MNKNLSFKRLTAGLLIVCLSIFLFPTNPSEAASSSREAFKQELRQMIYNVDTSVHDVSRYGVPYTEISKIYSEIKADPADKWMVAAYYSNLSISYTYSKKTTKTIQLNNVDGDVLGRYERLSKNVAEIKSGIEPSMKDIDKLIYLHDALVELVSYKFVAYQSYGAGGILGDKLGVCAGYTKALNLLLKDQGIECDYLSSKTIDHGWTSVLLDGQWYHVDSTWDDTKTPVTGKVSHKYLLRNDEEFLSKELNHVEWIVANKNTDNPSTSTKYKNWYVHDIVGKMAFEDGYWYYVDSKTNNIMRNNAEGTDAKVMLNGASKGAITLLDATGDGITYKESGKTYTIGYNGEESSEDILGESSNVENATQVEFYILPEGSTSYVSVGKGLIAEAKKSSDAKFVAGNIVMAPDLSQVLRENQTVDWNKITMSGSGKFFVKGTVITVEATEIPEKNTIPEKTGTVATFYLTLPNSTGLANIGSGLISEGGSSSKNDAIAKRIVEMPDVSAYLGKDEYIVWIKLTVYEAGKTPTVRGEVRHN